MNDYEERLLGIEDPPTDSSSVQTSWSGSSGSTTETPVEATARTGRMFKRLLFELIRPLFVRDIKPREEFLCEECRGPVLRRVLFCSRKCHYAHTERWVQRFKRYR